MIEETLWLVPGRVIVFRITGRPGLAGLKECDNLAIKMIAREGQPPFVNIIYDLRMADEPELSLMNMNNMRKNINPEAHKGWTIIVTPKPNPIMESIVSILSQVLRVRLCVIKDYEEALRFLFEVDATLPPMPANTAP